jgi:glycosyltransferase involved in cell wall biosynthesis
MEMDAPMPHRVLLLITDLKIGGTPIVVRELAIRLRARGWPVEVACLSEWGPVADQLVQAGVPVEALGARRSSDVRIIPRLARLIGQRGYETVFSFLVHANAVAAAASLLTRDVRWLQSIQTTQSRPRWHWLAQRVAHHAAQRVVVPSESVARVAGERSDISAAKLVVIPNALDADRFSGITPQWREGTPFPVGFIGRLDPVKRVGDLVEATGILGPAIHLHIFGEGSERPAIERLVAARKLGDRVVLHGATDRPEDALAQVGVLVLPSEAEGFGLVLIEAMAAGVPVVATRVPGIVDVVGHERTGLLVEPARPGELAMAIRRIMSDAPLRSRLIAAGRQEVRRRFYRESVLPRYEALLSAARG